MREQFQQILHDNNLLNSRKHVLLAVSGGVDSVVLLDLMQSLPISKRPKVSVAHVNHQLRNVSDSEERFVRDLSQKYHVPVHVHVWDEKMHPVSGIEAAARNERYTFFKKVMHDLNIDALLTAHHLDDQVETVLMRLTRGSSLDQLVGIKIRQTIFLDEKGTKSGDLIRPLLPFSKEEIYEYAQNEQLEYREDASNLSMAYTRNRFRHQIIPLLKNENEKFNEHIERFAKDLSDLIEISEAPISLAYQALVKVREGKIELDTEKFTAHSEALQRAVLKLVLENLYAGKAVVFKANYIDLIYDWLKTGEVNTQLDLTGDYLVEKTYRRAYFYQKSMLTKAVEHEKFTIDATQLDKWISLSENEAIGLFSLPNDTEETREEIAEAIEDPAQLLITEENLHLPLTIRHRLPGDRMTYQGLQGSKKIKDIFIDGKIPPQDRDLAWIVEDKNGNIIWLVSYRKSDLFTEVETDKLNYILKYKKK